MYILKITILLTARLLASVASMGFEETRTPEEQYLLNKRLMNAIETHSYSEIRVAIAQGANANKALAYAARISTPDVVQFLIRYGANVHSVDVDGNTPLHYTSKPNIPVLLQAGANINAQGDCGETPLHTCVHATHPLDVAQCLIEHGANLNITSKNGFTVLHRAIDAVLDENIHFALASLFIRHGADINARNMHNQTPLHLAANSCRHRCIRLLAQHDADVYALDKDGFTPLHGACLNGSRFSFFESAPSVATLVALAYCQKRVKECLKTKDHSYYQKTPAQHARDENIKSMCNPDQTIPHPEVMQEITHIDRLRLKSIKSIHSYLLNRELGIKLYS